MADWPQMLESGSFEIIRPGEIPLHTWTSSFSDDIMVDDFNSGDWNRVGSYFSQFEETQSTYPTGWTGVKGPGPEYPDQEAVNTWAGMLYSLAESGSIDMSGSLHFANISSSEGFGSLFPII